MIFFTISTLSNVSAIELKKKLPKIGGSSGSGVSLDDAKQILLKYSLSQLDYMEAQFHLFNALEMNDEANKTRKSIDFVKDSKEGKRLTNAFNTVSDNSTAIEGALQKKQLIVQKQKFITLKLSHLLLKDYWELFSFLPKLKVY